jgi:death-on-curing protein
MTTPLFLTWDEVLAIHRFQIQRFGGSDGLRDAGLLRSALAQPEATFGGQWLHPYLPDMAGAYLFHLVQNHPFVDGNKRVGGQTCLVFLAMNGHRLAVEPDLYTDLVLGVASGTVAKDQVAAFLRGHLGG